MKLPWGVSGMACSKALARLGFRAVRQVGSHLTMWSRDGTLRVVVPMHPSIDTGTLHKILKKAEVDIPDFLDAL
jgi:predicted RNA binding protein YcfA (HicA-like mRNA interferase family)